MFSSVYLYVIPMYRIITKITPKTKCNKTGSFFFLICRIRFLFLLYSVYVTLLSNENTIYYMYLINKQFSKLMFFAVNVIVLALGLRSMNYLNIIGKETIHVWYHIYNIHILLWAFYVFWIFVFRLISNLILKYKHVHYTIYYIEWYKSIY